MNTYEDKEIRGNLKEDRRLKKLIKIMNEEKIAKLNVDDAYEVRKMKDQNERYSFMSAKENEEEMNKTARLKYDDKQRGNISDESSENSDSDYEDNSSVNTSDENWAKNQWKQHYK